ncbi:MAG: hypothetical protein AAB270_08420 [Chloroflexota bacterium]
MAIVFEVTCPQCGHVLVARFEEAVASPGTCPSCGKGLVPGEVAMTVTEKP